MASKTITNPQDKEPLKIPLHFVLLIPFILTIVLSIGIVGSIAFVNGQKAVNDVARQLRSEVSARIEDHLQSFLEVPHEINQLNLVFIQQDWLDKKNTRVLQDYFLEQVRVHKTITSIYFGNTEGGIVGSGREGADGSLYIYNTENLKAGSFNKYAITSAGETGKLLSSIPNFDARTRSWYGGASQKGIATWSDIYILFTGQDMAISASSPVYDRQHHLIGVVSVDIFLSQIEKFLQTLHISQSGQSFIMERSGLLVAASTGEKPFIQNNGKMERIEARDSQAPIVKYAAEFLREHFGGNYAVTHEEQFDFEINGERYFLNVSPIRDPYGIDWLIVVVIPESDFMAKIINTNFVTFFVILLALAFSILSSAFIAQKISSRISNLNKATHAFIRGEEPGLVLGNSRISEIDELTNSFAEMERQLHQTLNDLRAEIDTRNWAEEELRKSKNQYDSLVSNIPMGVYIIRSTPEGAFTFEYINSKVAEMFNVSVEKFLADPQAGFKPIHPDDLASLIKLNQERFQQPQPFEWEGRAVINGVTKWLRIASSPEPLENGDILWNGIVVNITERKQAEEALRASQSLYHSLVESSPLSICRKDLAGRFTFANHRFLEESQTSLADLIGKTDFDLHPPELAKKYRHDDQAIIDSGQVRELIEERAVIGGETVVIQSIKVPIYDGAGKVNGIQIAFWDITNHKRMEEKLQESEKRFRSLVETTSDWIWEVNTSGVYTYASPRIRDILGFEPAEIIGKAPFDLMSSEEAQQVSGVFTQIFAAHKLFSNLENKNVHKDGHTVILETSGVPIVDAEGTFCGYRGIDRDITARKRAEIELIQSKEALEIAHHELEKSFAREQQLAHIDELTGINNRRSLFELAEREFNVALRYRLPLSVLMFDIDHFKEVNDTFGHAMGDQVLECVTQVVCTKLRSADIIGRYGGDEFVVLLPQTNMQEVSPLADRIHASIDAIRLETNKGLLAVTISIGVAQMIYNTSEPDTVENLFLRADKALYAAKKDGRNRTVIFDAEHK